MEKILLQMARRLNAYDEASLMAMWDKYAARVRQFEPTKRWEEAALVFSFIQALRWKNQLFNHHWAAQAGPVAPRPAGEPALDLPGTAPEGPALRSAVKDKVKRKKPVKVLSFKPRGQD
jgi:hypothetical protein